MARATTSKKSATCSGRKGPLTEYESDAAALEAAEYLRGRYPDNPELIPYECRTCAQWHLSPAPNTDCKRCKKKAYETKEFAERGARIGNKERRVDLRIYECPHGAGWHLTSQTLQYTEIADAIEQYGKEALKQARKAREALKEVKSRGLRKWREFKLKRTQQK